MRFSGFYPELLLHLSRVSRKPNLFVAGCLSANFPQQKCFQGFVFFAVSANKDNNNNNNIIDNDIININSNNNNANSNKIKNSEIAATRRTRRPPSVINMINKVFPKVPFRDWNCSRDSTFPAHLIQPTNRPSKGSLERLQTKAGLHRNIWRQV